MLVNLVRFCLYSSSVILKSWIFLGMLLFIFSTFSRLVRCKNSYIHKNPYFMTLIFCWFDKIRRITDTNPRELWLVYNLFYVNICKICQRFSFHRTWVRQQPTLSYTYSVIHFCNIQGVHNNVFLSWIKYWWCKK